MPKYLSVDSANVVRMSELLKDRRETMTLTRGQEIPSWVSEADLERLEAAGALSDDPSGTPAVVVGGPEAQAFPGAFELLRGNVDAAVAAAAGEGVEGDAAEQFADAVGNATSPLKDSGTGTPTSAEATPSPTFAGAIPQDPALAARADRVAVDLEAGASEQGEPTGDAGGSTTAPAKKAAAAKKAAPSSSS